MRNYVLDGIMGLAGYEAVPGAWIDVILQREYLERACHQFNLALAP